MKWVCRNILLMVLVFLGGWIPIYAEQLKPVDGESLRFKASKFPSIGAIIGKATVVTGKPEKETELKVKMVLREKALFNLSEEALVRVDLSEEDSIFLYAGAEFDLPVIDPENGNIEYLLLKKGRMRLVIQSEAVRVLKSPLFTDSIGRGDYIFTMLPKEARFSVDILKGSLAFRGLLSELYQPLFEKDSAFFQGVLENGEIAYDILMHGKKVAKGNVGKISKLSAKENEAFLAPLKQLEKSFIAQKAKKAPPPDPTMICKNPGGRLQDCSWVCEGSASKKDCKPGAGVQCIRRRCSAEGEWVDAYSLRVQEWKCSAKPLVTKCDY